MPKKGEVYQHKQITDAHYRVDAVGSTHVVLKGQKGNEKVVVTREELETHYWRVG